MKKSIDYIKTRPLYIWCSWLMFVPFCAELAAWPYWFFIKKRTLSLWYVACLIFVFAYSATWIPAFFIAEWAFQKGSIGLIVASLLVGYICGVCATYTYALWREKYVKRTK